MKRYAPTIAAVIGGFIGIFWVSVAGAMSEGFRMGPVWGTVHHLSDDRCRSNSMVVSSRFECRLIRNGRFRYSQGQKG